MENKIIDVLKQCYDPEIPIDLWNLGLIYKINILPKSNNQSDIHILMTLTTPGCMMGQHMADDIKGKLENLKNIDEATVEGADLNYGDWIVAYNNDVIVGARKYTEGGMIDIPIMGYDNSSENTKIATAGYCENGDLPIIKVHRPDGQIIEMDVIKIDGDLEFKGIGHATIVLKKD